MFQIVSTVTLTYRNIITSGTGDEIQGEKRLQRSVVCISYSHGISKDTLLGFCYCMEKELQALII